MTTVKGGAAVAGIEVLPDGSALVVATSNGKIIVARYTPGANSNPVRIKALAAVRVPTDLSSTWRLH
ncbi:hypothetical protein ACIRRH_33405 [Kitasatospora sp. NPDC101235]|uniref:hypothetical protein n=1 Tax=Kitasatospora sp. NPDC101235 TaxID=3364101 RepID=UPI0037FE6676